ncbi:sugar phosphate isomerase/epimerase [candidate division KSB1 bacterium]|nr:sugar phosphate isomerase/epimerase [candidate division KSB1 bacterium]
MSNLKIGVMVESFRLSAREGIAKAAEVGAQGIQIYTSGKEIHPDKLDKAARKELLKYIHSHDLVVSALCGDFGGHGFEKAEENAWKIDITKRTIDLAVDLQTNVVTTHIGVIPADRASARYRIMFDAMKEIAEYGAPRGITLAIETGPEVSTVLRAFIEDVDSKGLGVNLDPANLRMVAGEEPVQAVRNLKEFIVHTHAKDGIQLIEIEPEKIYHWFADSAASEISNPDDYFKEVPLGEGHVNFPTYIKALREEAGYDGFFTIEREVGENPYNDIKEAVKFLKAL